MCIIYHITVGRQNGKLTEVSLIGKDKIDWRRMEALKDNFSESDLPFMVDVLDWHAISEHFRQVIDTQYEVIITDQGEGSGLG